MPAGKGKILSEKDHGVTTDSAGQVKDHRGNRPPAEDLSDLAAVELHEGHEPVAEAGQEEAITEFPQRRRVSHCLSTEVAVDTAGQPGNVFVIGFLRVTGADEVRLDTGVEQRTGRGITGYDQTAVFDFCEQVDVLLQTRTGRHANHGHVVEESEELFHAGTLHQVRHRAQRVGHVDMRHHHQSLDVAGNRVHMAPDLIRKPVNELIREPFVRCWAAGPSPPRLR